VEGILGVEGESTRNDEKKKQVKDGGKLEMTKGEKEKRVVKRDTEKILLAAEEEKRDSLEVVSGTGNRSEDVGTVIKKKKTKLVERFGRKESTSFWKPRLGGTSDWLTFQPGGNWVWWVVAGYSVSVLVFRLVDWVNGIVVPVKWFEGASRNIVNQMVAPEGNDVIALLIGAVAPCLSAPLWEEVFYR
jgi:hypothetical protein